MSAEAERPTNSNRHRIFEALRVRGRMARVELAAITALSPATVTALTAEMIAEGFIEESTSLEEENGDAAARRGRPRVLLQLRPDAVFVAGIKISMHQISVTVTNFVGDLLGARTIAVHASRQSQEVILDRVEAALRETLEALDLDKGRIRGVGVGIPGFIDWETGDSHWSPVFGEQLVHFGPLLQERLDRPVMIDNDAHLATLAEQWFGAGKGVRNFLVVSLEHGVGMGAVIDGRLYRGARGFGGEFGHTKIQRSGALCRCGQRGCIEAYLADYAILREASTFEPETDVSDPIAANAALRDIIRRAKQGDAFLTSIYERAGEILGLGLANLINIFAPELVVLTGAGVEAAPLFEGTMRRTMRENTLAAATEGMALRFAPSSDEFWARGAAALVLERQTF